MRKDSRLILVSGEQLLAAFLTKSGTCLVLRSTVDAIHRWSPSWIVSFRLIRTRNTMSSITHTDSLVRVGLLRTGRKRGVWEVIALEMT